MATRQDQVLSERLGLVNADEMDHRHITGTVTLLFTDIEGSTRLLRRLGSDYAAVLMTHHRLLRDAFVSAGGIEVDTQGDGFFMVFPRASTAVAAALAAQRALARQPWP